MTDPFVTPKELYERLLAKQRQRDAEREEEERQLKADRRELLKRLAEEKRATQEQKETES